jgi:hypothetical protein
VCTISQQLVMALITIAPTCIPIRLAAKSVSNTLAVAIALGTWGVAYHRSSRSFPPPTPLRRFPRPAPRKPEKAAKAVIPGRAPPPATPPLPPLPPPSPELENCHSPGQPRNIRNAATSSTGMASRVAASQAPIRNARRSICHAGLVEKMWRSIRNAPGRAGIGFRKSVAAWRQLRGYPASGTNRSGGR